MEDREGRGGVSGRMVERMVAVATGCDALTQALDCMRAAVRADADGGMAFATGMLDVLRLSAENVQREAQALVEEAGRLATAD